MTATLLIALVLTTSPVREQVFRAPWGIVAEGNASREASLEVTLFTPLGLGHFRSSCSTMAPSEGPTRHPGGDL